LIVQRAAFFATDPIVVSSRGQPQYSKSRRQWHRLSGTLDGAENAPLALGVCNAIEPQPETRKAQHNQNKTKNRSEHRHATFQLGNPFPKVSLSLPHLVERHYVTKPTANPTQSRRVWDLKLWKEVWISGSDDLCFDSMIVGVAFALGHQTD